MIEKFHKNRKVLSLSACAVVSAAVLSGSSKNFSQPAFAVSSSTTAVSSSISNFTNDINGNTDTTNTNTATSASRVSLTAHSDMAGGVGAHITMKLNGITVGSAYVNSSIDKTYAFPVASQLTSGDVVEIAYDNDAIVNGTDRNLYVSSVNGVSTPLSYVVDGSVKTYSGVAPWNGVLKYTGFKPANPVYGAVGANTTGTSDKIIATTGQVISNMNIHSSSGDCVVIPPGVHDVTIENNNIGSCINGVGIQAENGSYNIFVKNNIFHDVESGMWINHGVNPVIFTNNTAYNILGPFPRGQMIQFDNVSGGNWPSSVSYNVSDKLLSNTQTHLEDHINAYMSSGVSGSQKTEITCNKIRGGDSASGSAVVVGDNGGSHFDVSKNLIVRTANTGIGVAGGDDFTITNNTIVQDGSSAASLTDGEAYVQTINPGMTPTNVVVTGNDGVARHWIYGNGNYDPGFYNPVGVADIGNNWNDRSLNGDTVWNTSIAGC